MKYEEDKILDELMEYIRKTYGQHYVQSETNIQALDAMEATGVVSDFCRGNIIKYAMRYGKKDGYNKKDLQKIAHYAILLMYFDKEKFSNGS